jgi:hypothetical protein
MGGRRKKKDDNIKKIHKHLLFEKGLVFLKINFGFVSIFGMIQHNFGLDKSR